MNRFIGILSAYVFFISVPAFSVEIKESCEDVRAFNCVFSYELDGGKKISGTAKMEDYKYLFAGESCEVYQSKLTMMVSNQAVVYITEDDNNANDIEESRDSDPKSHSGWGGKEFYIEPKSMTAIMTAAPKRQMGLAKRAYDLVFLKFKEDGEPEPYGQGHMSCELIKK